MNRAIEKNYVSVLITYCYFHMVVATLHLATTKDYRVLGYHLIRMRSTKNAYNMHEGRREEGRDGNVPGDS